MMKKNKLPSMEDVIIYIIYFVMAQRRSNIFSIFGFTKIYIFESIGVFFTIKRTYTASNRNQYNDGKGDKGIFTNNYEYRYEREKEEKYTQVNGWCEFTVKYYFFIFFRHNLFFTFPNYNTMLGKIQLRVEHEN